ncbi:hypothetical protein [Acidipila rosea]|uniref:Uncharacterized protein n=1 Tax=Acidipila rosea TaxID=768535 RepID=A0A4R1LGJ9_9BACT|nr:hypothetical protein [Acidipila rosea]MBW4026035.1 hypothetical protein [Acidobacteriota bacterium]MBW4044046.1 hypothetical protein [Acidobacteriota bacterium]TCK75983.1 hypothetical protein C7378_0987 [Acidipila rosea]
MSIMPVLWIVWAGVTAVLLALLAYRGTITRYEEDQLFLDDDSSVLQHKEQDLIQKRIARIRPFVSVMTGVTGLLTATIIGAYVWDAVKQFR